MKTKSVLLGAAVASLMLIGGAANATVHSTVEMTFASGATFDGTITFSSGAESIVAVTGMLTGYEYGTYGYVGYGSDSINWVWDNNNYSSGVSNYSNFLMDGPGNAYFGGNGGYTNWIQFAYNYSAAPVLTFTSGVSYGETDNYVNYSDPMVSGSISNAVPETSTWVMMLAGFAGLGFLGYRRNKAAFVAA